MIFIFMSHISKSVNKKKKYKKEYGYGADPIKLCKGAMIVKNPHGHIPLKVPNVEFNFDACIEA